MPSRLVRRIVNYLGLQGGWLACALGAAAGNAWLGPLAVGLHLGLHIRWSAAPGRELRYALAVGIFGSAVDGLKRGLGFIAYASPTPPVEWLAPVWIMAMWVLFATSLTGSLVWLQGRYVLAALAGAVFGPLSYLAGARLGAVSFVHDVTSTLAALALLWGMIVPFLAWGAKTFVGDPLRIAAGGDKTR